MKFDQIVTIIDPDLPEMTPAQNRQAAEALEAMFEEAFRGAIIGVNKPTMLYVDASGRFRSCQVDVEPEREPCRCSVIHMPPCRLAYTVS